MIATMYKKKRVHFVLQKGISIHFSPKFLFRLDCHSLASRIVLAKNSARKTNKYYFKNYFMILKINLRIYLHVVHTGLNLQKTEKNDSCDIVKSACIHNTSV